MLKVYTFLAEAAHKFGLSVLQRMRVERQATASKTAASPLSGQNEQHELRADHRGSNLKEHHVEECRLVGIKKTHDYHVLSQYSKAARQRQEMQGSFVNLSRDRNWRVLGSIKWFNVKNGYGFINRNDTRVDMFGYQTAITQKNPHKIKRSVGEGETVGYGASLVRWDERLQA